MKVLIIRDPLSDAIKKEIENLLKIGFFLTYDSLAGPILKKCYRNSTYVCLCGIF
jgi:hypothetical protein